MEEETGGEPVLNEGGTGDGGKPKELSAAQKKREKLRLKKKLGKEAEGAVEDGGGDPNIGQLKAEDDGGAVGTSSKPKKKPGGAKDAKGKAKGPSKAQIAAIQAHIQQAKDEEERLLREEDEKERVREEAEAARQQKLKEEQEKKDRKKAAEKLRKAKLKAEGKLLTPKQKLEKQRAQQLIESLKSQGAQIPGGIGGGGGAEGFEKKPRLGTRVRPSKSRQQSVSEESMNDDLTKRMEGMSIEGVEGAKKEEAVIKEAWDLSDDDEKKKGKEDSTESSKMDEVDEVEAAEEAEVKSEDDSGVDSEELEADNSNEIVGRVPAVPRVPTPKKEEPSVRIEKRRLENEKNKSSELLRSPVVCVLGHVDTGKTKILDKLRRTHVQDGEAGGITQQIGATNVPIDAIKEAAKFVKNFQKFDVKLPGLLLIDTPGHESFSNLRSRGSSLCDIAILVVDIMHGLEPQTIESLNLLKKKKTPCIVALNKIDRIYDWSPEPKRDVRDVIKNQKRNSFLEFEKRVNEVIVQFAMEGLNATLFYENPDPSEYISMVPTSALSGEGMGNLMALIVEYSQTMLEKRLMFSNELEATVLEVKAIPGLGTTIDVILINGGLREGETLILAGTEGPVVTQIRSLLTPQPMKELRVKNTYIEYKEIKGATGIKVTGKDLETAIPGLNVLVAYHPDEVELCKEEISRELGALLGSFRVQERGVYVQASTLGSLEALLEFLKSSAIPYSGIRIGPVVKKDVMKASVMLEHESQYAVILAFDVKIERDAQDLADHLGVKIFQADIIYHLFDKFTAYQDNIKSKKRDEFKSIAVFPCKLKILPQFIFKSRDPIVIGVSIEAGTLKDGTPISVPSRDNLGIGRVTSIEINHKQVDKAVKGQEVCIKIEPIPGESAKMLGRHFEVEDVLVSKISRESIDACKEYFRSDLTKQDWQLMVELKKLFGIM